MTGVHARFPPQAGIRPGVDAGFSATAHVPAPLPPAAFGGGRGAGSRASTGVTEKGREPPRGRTRVLKHGPMTADAETGS